MKRCGHDVRYNGLGCITRIWYCIVLNGVHVHYIRLGQEEERRRRKMGGILGSREKGGRGRTREGCGWIFTDVGLLE